MAIVKMVEEKEESFASKKCTETDCNTVTNSVAVLPTEATPSIQEKGVSWFWIANGFMILLRVMS